MSIYTNYIEGFSFLLFFSLSPSNPIVYKEVRVSFSK